MRRAIQWIGVAAGAALSAAGTSSMRRECGETPSICADFDRARLVFLANVESVTPEVVVRDPDAVRPQTVGFELLEGFKSTTGGFTTLTFNIAAPQERAFTRGETVVVYASQSPARDLWSVACTRTRRVSRDDLEMVVLRELAAAGPGAAVEGAVALLPGPRPPAPAPTAPLDRLQITAESLDRGEILSAASQTGGYFLLPWLLGGRYRIKVDSDLYVPVERDIFIATRARCAKLDPFTVRLR